MEWHIRIYIESVISCIVYRYKSDILIFYLFLKQFLRLETNKYYPSKSWNRILWLWFDSIAGLGSRLEENKIFLRGMEVLRFFDESLRFRSVARKSRHTLLAVFAINRTWGGWFPFGKLFLNPWRIDTVVMRLVFRENSSCCTGCSSCSTFLTSWWRSNAMRKLVGMIQFAKDCSRVLSNETKNAFWSSTGTAFTSNCAWTKISWQSGKTCSSRNWR